MIGVVGLNSADGVPYLRSKECLLLSAPVSASSWETGPGVRAVIDVQVAGFDRVSLAQRGEPPFILVQRRHQYRPGTDEAKRVRDLLDGAYRELARERFDAVCAGCPAWRIAVPNAFDMRFGSIAQLRLLVRKIPADVRCPLDAATWRWLKRLPTLLAVSARVRIGCTLAHALAEARISERSIRRWHVFSTSSQPQPLATMRPGQLIVQWERDIASRMRRALHVCGSLQSDYAQRHIP